MIILDIIAVELAAIDALLFAYMILAVGLLQFDVAFVLFIFEYAQHRIRVPFAPGYSANPLSVQCFCNNKASLAAYIVAEDPPHNFSLVRINHQVSLLVFVIPQKASGINDNFALFKLSPITPL